MASHVVVIATDLRRTTIKVTPGTYLSDVLEQACQKLNLSSDKYLIKHKQKQVDLSNLFRTSGLTPGAKLELVQKSKSPSLIQVALQVPQPEAREIPGGRLIHKFPSDLTIWKVLRQFESGNASIGKNLNITARGIASTTSGAASGSGQLYYETPVLNIMGRELASFPDFQKTLSQLGYNSGSVLIRLGYRKTEQTLYDAMADITQFFRDVDAEDSQQSALEATKDAPPQSEPEAEQTSEQVQEAIDTPMTEPETVPTGSSTDEQQIQSESSAPATGQDSEPEKMEVDNSTPQNPLEPVNVFLAPSGATPAAALAPANETDYMPTIAHAQLHQARLLQSSRNKRLPSDRELEDKAAAEEARINAIKSVLIKVRFPDNTSSDWEVSANETGRFLYQAVRHVMANENQPFHLVLSGVKTVIKDNGDAKNGLIKTYKLSGRTLVNLVWDDSVPAPVRKQPFLKSSVARQGQEVKAPEPIEPADDKNNASVAVPQREERGEGSGDKIAKKIPKWLKLGKK